MTTLTKNFTRVKKDVVHSVRLTPAQSAELVRAGGSDWVRAILDERIAAIKARRGKAS